MKAVAKQGSVNEKYKKQIMEIHKDRAKNDSNSKTLAQTIRTDVSGIFPGGKYVNELIQNADDANATELSFTLTNNCLVVSHNGNHFDDQNIQSVCDSANSTKVGRLTGTGYKGIGFKAVFSIAEKVIILSDGAHFRFDKFAALWKGKPDEYPWQIVPIWTEFAEIPAQARPHYDPKKVTFILVIKDQATLTDIQDHLSKLTSNPSLLIYLQKIRTICVIEEHSSTSKKTISMTRYDEEALEECRVEVRDSSKQTPAQTTWLTYTDQMTLGDKEKQQLKESKDIPEKFKIMEDITVHFAAPKSRETIKARTLNNVISSLVPTRISMKLPFNCNAALLLNSERSHFQTTPEAIQWNLIFIQAIALLQFYWFESLAADTSENWLYPLDLIATPESTTFPTEDLKEAKANFKRCFDSGMQRCAFIRPFRKGANLKVAECIVDVHGFIEKFGIYISDVKLKKHIHSQYNDEHRKKLITLGATSFSVDEIFKIINTSEFKVKLLDPKVNFELIKYLFNLTNSNEELIKKVKELPVFLGSDGKLHKASDLLIPREALDEKFSDTGLLFIDTRLNESIKDDENIKKWLARLGGKPSTIKTLVERVNTLKTADASIQFCRLIVQLDKAKKIKEDDYANLSHLNLVTVQGTLLTPTQCYLSREFKPEFDVQDTASRFKGFISTEYMPEEDLDVERWSTFFLKMGVSQRVNENNIVSIARSLNDNNAHVIFIQQLFRFYMTKFKGDWQKEFSVLLSSESSEWLETIQIKTIKGEFVSPASCYLADSYGPVKPLQSVGEGIHFVSEEYRQSGGKVASWKAFFTSLGVKQNIKVEVRTASYSDPKAKGYINYLESLTYPSEPACQETSLFPEKTRRYSHQHTVTNFIDIEFIDQIIGTPIFWQTIITHWQNIYPPSKTVTYTTACSMRQVRSSLYYHALEAIKKQGLGDDFTALYSPRIKSIAGSLLRSADVGVDFTDEQSDFFGFKKVLSIEDIMVLLKAFQSGPVTEELLHRITETYRDLLKSSDSLTPEMMEGLKLLTESETFDSPTNIRGFLLTERDIKRAERMTHFLWRPEKFTEDDFIHLCRIFGVKTIQRGDLIIRTEMLPSDNSPDMKNRLLKSLQYIVTAEQMALRNFALQPTEADLKTKLSEIYIKVMVIVACPVGKIELGCDGFFRQEVRAWFDYKSSKLYFTPTEGQVDRITQSRISEQLVTYLKLTIEVSEFDLVLSEEPTQKAWLNDQGETAKQLFTIAGHHLEVLKTQPLPLVEVESDEKMHDNDEKEEKGEEVESPHPLLPTPLPSIKKNSKTPHVDLENKEDENEPISENSNLNVSSLPQSRKRKEPSQANISQQSSLPQASRTTADSSSSSSETHQTTSDTQERKVEAEFCDENESTVDVFSSTQHEAPSFSNSQSSAPKKQKQRSYQPSFFDQAQKKTVEDELALRRIGIQGEKHVYDKLYQKYKDRSESQRTYEGKRYSDFEEIPNQGFRVKIESSTQTTVKTLLWLNKGKDEHAPSFEDHDMLMETKNQHGVVLKHKKIEVKANVANKEPVGIFSENETQQFSTNPNYTVYHVSDVDLPDKRSAKKIKNPLQQLKDGSVTFVAGILSFGVLYQNPSSVVNPPRGENAEEDIDESHPSSHI